MRAGLSLRNSGCRGFTLVELLVTITIIVVLAALSVIGINRMRSAAGNSNCISNLRQLAVAGLAYAAETGTYPPYGRQPDGSNAYWFQVLAKDLGLDPGLGAAEIERDPSFPTCHECLKKHNAQSFPRNNPIRTYAMNEYVARPERNSSGLWTFPAIRVSQANNPSQTAFFMDGTKVSGIYWDSICRIGEWRRAENFIHGGKANIAFLDGHVESRTIADVPTDPAHKFWNPRAQ
jgi:prepilin-type processing-associated H-X9-DG protein/prepilin-type N-terminal cleavage/methylation domain-containing protein